MAAETPSLSPAEETDKFLLAGKLTSTNITDPKISNQILKNWETISDVSVAIIKTAIIKHIRENPKLQGSGWITKYSIDNKIDPGSLKPSDIKIKTAIPYGDVGFHIQDLSGNPLANILIKDRAPSAPPTNPSGVEKAKMAEMVNRFKELRPDYIDVIAANSTEIKLKTITAGPAMRGAAVGKSITTTFDADLGEITVKTTANDPFTKMEWKNNMRLDNMELSSNALAILSNAKFGLNIQRSIANIESANDKSLLIPTIDGSGFATICPGGTVNIYDKNNPVPTGGIARKPVIYLYPKSTTDITVSVGLKDATMIAEYPKTQKGEWKVTATPRGNLTDTVTNKKYSYLFWEAEKHQGFEVQSINANCISSSDITSYLEKSLKTLGLNARETNDFMVYWLPVLEKNPYSLIEWKTTEYTDMAKLNIFPKPDTLIRVFMVFRKSETLIKTGNPILPKNTRKGYSVIEWGGCNIDEGTHLK